MILWSATNLTQAAIVGSVADNLDGTYTYSYIVDNTTGGFDIAAWSLEFDLLTSELDWDQLDIFSGGDVDVPTIDWFAAPGVPILGFSTQDFLSLTPTADVLMGSMLGGFSFVSAFLPGTVPFFEFGPLGGSASGATVGPVPFQPVPEPVSWMLGIAGALLCWIWRRK